MHGLEGWRRSSSVVRFGVADVVGARLHDYALCCIIRDRRAEVGLRVGVAGASGYAGGELLRLLLRQRNQALPCLGAHLRTESFRPAPPTTK